MNAKSEKAGNSGDAGEITALYTDDAALLQPGSPMVHHKDNIQSYSKAMIDMGVTNVDLKTSEITISGNDAFEVGTLLTRLAIPRPRAKPFSSGERG